MYTIFFLAQIVYSHVMRDEDFLWATHLVLVKVLSHEQSCQGKT